MELTLTRTSGSYVVVTCDGAPSQFVFLVISAVNCRAAERRDLNRRCNHG